MSAEMPPLKLPPPIWNYEGVNFGSMLYNKRTDRTSPEEYNEEDEEDFLAIEHAKKENGNCSSKVIFSHILKEEVPLYKFKKSYPVYDLIPWFTIGELIALKKKYESEGIEEEDAKFMNELIRQKEEYLREQDKQNLRVQELRNKFNQPQSTCVVMGGRIKNSFRKKNKSSKRNGKSKRVSKRVKKNKRYSRKLLKNSLH
jgi:hypothetical protein